MKKYTVQIAMSYIQTVEVLSDSQESAENQAFEMFDLSKAYQGEGDAWTVEISEGSTK